MPVSLKVRGGSLKASELNKILKASYEKNPSETIDGYILDKSLSTDTAKVYYDPITKQAVVAHRGTKGASDWLNNVAYVAGAYEYTDRYKKGKETQKKAEQKYGKSNISTIAHSQGSVLARKLGQETKEIINVNPAYSFEKPSKKEYNVRSSTDVVSGLYAPVKAAQDILYPNYSKNHNISVTSKSLNPLTEHSYDVLDRIKDTKIGVGSGLYGL